MLTDDVIGLYDCSSTSTLEVAVRFKRDMDADKLIDNVIENEAVRTKSDMDAEKSVENKNEYDAVRSKCDDEAEAVDEDAKTSKEIKMEQQQQKIYLNIMTKSQVKMKQLERLLRKGEVLQGERNNT